MTEPPALRIHPTWRIVAAIVIAQLPGAAFGVWLDPIGDWFTNGWYGAAFAAPFGFVAGILWQTQADIGILRNFRWHVFAYGLFSAALPTFGVLSFDT